MKGSAGGLALCLLVAVVAIWYQSGVAICGFASLSSASRSSGPAKLQRFRPSETSACEVAAALERHGVVVIDFSEEYADVIDKAMTELSSGRMADANVRFGAATQLWKNPLDPKKEPALQRLAMQPLIQEAAEILRPRHGQGSARMIGNEVRLLILSPGSTPGDLHRDVVDTSKVPLERPLQWGLNAIWAVDDFTRDNGATRFLAGSHTAEWPQGTWKGDHDEAENLTEVAAMPKGSVVLYYACLLHGSGENSVDATRTGLNFNYAFVDESGGRPAGWGW